MGEGKEEVEILVRDVFLHLLSVRCGNRCLYVNTPCLY